MADRVLTGELRPVELVTLLLAVYGPGRPGRPDTAAAAAGLGVSTSTVRRWLRGETTPRPQVRAVLRRQACRHGRARTRWPRPPAETLRREAQALIYAQDALRRLELPRCRGIRPAWRTQGWLEPHLVLLFHLPTPRLWQVALTGTTGDRIHTGQASGAVLVDVTPVDNYFQAVIVRAAVLELIDPWRVEATTGEVRQARGRTNCWRATGPQIDLDTIRQEALGLARGL